MVAICIIGMEERKKSYTSIATNVLKHQASGNMEALNIKEKADLAEIFELCDSDGSGNMDWKELNRALQGLGFFITQKRARYLLREADADKDGYLNCQEFCELIEALSISERNYDHEITEVFKLFDKDNQGRLSLKNLKTLCNEVGAVFPDHELRDMITEADRKGDGTVSLEEFCCIMKRTNLFPH